MSQVIRGQRGSPCSISEGQDQGWGVGECTVRSNTSWVTVIQTNTSENITFPQLHCQTVERKHSSRMLTARLPTVRTSVATRCQCHEGAGRGRGFLQVNKFQHVSRLGHRMSLESAGEQGGWGRGVTVH